MSEQSTRYFKTLAASESTYGTDAVNTVLTTATADIIYQDLISINVDNTIEITEINRVRGSQSGVAHCPFKDLAAVTASVPLTGKVGSGAGDEAPYYNMFLKAAGLSETIVSATSATYAPSSVNQEAMSVYKFSRNLEDTNWRLELATGVRGTATIRAEVNQEATFEFEGSGIYDDLISDEAVWFDASTGEIQFLKDGSTSVTARTTGTETQATKLPMKCQGATITIGGTTYPVASFELAFNWSVDLVRTINDAQSVSKVLLTRGEGSRIGGSLDLQDSATAMEAARDAIKAGTEVAFSFTLTNGTDTIVISGSKLQFGFWSPGENGGVRTYTLPFFLNGDWSALAADNDFSMVYT